MKKTISVLSSKWGVRKTAISVSLIDFLAQKNYKITAVDADVNAPNLSKWFDNITTWDEEKEVKIFPLPNKYKKCKNVKIICNGKELPIELEKRGNVYLKEKYTPSFDNYNINMVSGDIMEGKTGSGKVVEGTIKASELIQGVRTSEAISDHLTLTMNKDSFELFAEGDTDTVNLSLSKDMLEGLKSNGNCKSLFSIDYLSNMIKPVKSNEPLTIHLGNDNPTRVEFPIANQKGHVTYLLAPRIESE